MAMGKQSKEYRIRIRRQALAALGGCCAQCGMDDWRCLQIDHVNGGGGQERKDDPAGTITRQLRIIQGHGKSDLQILCANCNWIKRYVNDESRKRY